jgi:ABC-type uncharacterized transport system substrate-binding protein
VSRAALVFCRGLIVKFITRQIPHSLRHRHRSRDSVLCCFSAVEYEPEVDVAERRRCRRASSARATFGSPVRLLNANDLLRCIDMLDLEPHHFAGAQALRNAANRLQARMWLLCVSTNGSNSCIRWSRKPRARDFISLLGGAAAAWPLAARAQQRSLPVIGYLGTESPVVWTTRLRALHLGLAATGYVEGRDVAIEYRWADGQNDRLPAMAAELVRRDVSVIIADNTPAALAAKAATMTIPIVFYIGLDPVTLGLVTSLSRPGGNVTGVTGINQELGAKRLELLHELLPTASVFATIVNPGNPSAADTASRELGAAAQKLGLQLHVLPTSSEREFDGVFAAVAQMKAGGLVVGGDSLFNGRTEQLATLALRYAVPTIYQYRDFADAGGLMSYGGNFADWYRLIGSYTGRILKGEKPADLPVQQATRVELIINMKTAKALGLTFPITLLGRADEVIE